MLDFQQVEDSFNEEGTEVHAFEGDQIVLKLIIFEANVLKVVKLLAISQQGCIDDGQPNRKGLSNHWVRFAELCLYL